MNKLPRDPEIEDALDIIMREARDTLDLMRDIPEEYTAADIRREMKRLRLAIQGEINFLFVHPYKETQLRKAQAR